MNEEAEKLFNQIVKKDPSGLSPSDIEFLTARRDYMTSDQKAKFESVLHLKTIEKKVIKTEE